MVEAEVPEDEEDDEKAVYRNDCGHNDRGHAPDMHTVGTA